MNRFAKRPLRAAAVATCAMVAAFAFAVAFAADKHPIDKWTENCASNAKSTADEIACQEKAYQKWDAELNVQYKKLMAQLKPAEKKNLQVSQTQWLKFRDQEFKVIDDIYAHKSGSMFAPMQAASRARVIRERAILLQHYSEILNDM